MMSENDDNDGRPLRGYKIIPVFYSNTEQFGIRVYVVFGRLFQSGHHQGIRRGPTGLF